MAIRQITYWVRVRKHLIPVTVKTVRPAQREWLLRLQALANEMCWAHAGESETLVEFARDGLDLGVIEPGDLPQ